VKAVRENGVILGVGSQQRSDANFQHAVKMVQEGRLGVIEKVNACVGPPPAQYDLPEEPIHCRPELAALAGPPGIRTLQLAVETRLSLSIPRRNEHYWAVWRYLQGDGWWVHDRLGSAYVRYCPVGDRHG